VARHERGFLLALKPAGCDAYGENALAAQASGACAAGFGCLRYGDARGENAAMNARGATCTRFPACVEACGLQCLRRKCACGAGFACMPCGDARGENAAMGARNAI